MKNILTMIFLSSVLVLQADPLNKNDRNAIDKSVKSPNQAEYDDSSYIKETDDPEDDFDNTNLDDDDEDYEDKKLDDRIFSEKPSLIAFQEKQIPDQTPMSPEDEALNKKISNVLQKFHYVSFSMKNGNVVLTGTVKTEELKNDAESRVRNVKGVNNVINEINVKENQ